MMKFAAALFSQISRSKSDEPDAFELRLISMGAEGKRPGRSLLPTLFHRAARSAV